MNRSLYRIRIIIKNQIAAINITIQLNFFIISMAKQFFLKKNKPTSCLRTT